MRDFHYAELEPILQDDNYLWYPVHQRAYMKAARLHAFMYRRQLLRRLAAIPPAKKRSAVGYNRHMKRLARDFIVKAKRRGGSSPGYNTTSAVLLSRKKGSILLDALHPARTRSWSPIEARLKHRSRASIVAKDFSYLSAARETQKTMAEIARSEASDLSAQIHFLDPVCIDVGAWLVLSAMRNDMAPIFTGGAISNQMSKVLDALGLTGPLRFSVDPEWGDEQDIWAFPVRSRRLAGSSTSPTLHLDPQAKEKAGDALCVAISEWLSACAGQSLNPHGRRMVKTITGECLDNAERHSRRSMSTTATGC